MKIVLSSIGVQSGTDQPLALYYLKAYLLKGRGPGKTSLKVRIRVFHEEDRAPDIASAILRYKPGLVGFSCYIWNIEKILCACRKIKKIDPGIKIVLGGPEVTPRAAEILADEPAVYAVVRGEGEATFSDLVNNPGKPLSEIPGLSFRGPGEVVNNPGRRQIGDLREIPSPYLSHVVDLKDKNIVDVPLETTRGCVSRCNYCYYHKNFPKVRYFPLSRVEKELKLILASRPKELYLMDATFNSDPARAKKILKLVIKYNRVSGLHVELKAELVDEEMAGLLRRANAMNIEIGIQSAGPRTLRAVNRGFNREKFERGIRLLNKYKLFYEIQLIDALPFQSYEGLKRSLDWLYGLHPAKVVIFPLAVLPGTALRENAGCYGISYSARPPYYACKSSAMPEAKVARARKLCFAMERLYDSQVFQQTLYALKEKGGVRISDVLDDWLVWESAFKRRCRDYPVFLNNRSPQFLEYFCRRHNKLRVYREILPDLEKALADYRAAYYS